MRRHQVTQETTMGQLVALLDEYELHMSRVWVDRDGFNVSLTDSGGQIIALGLAPSFHGALEDAFRDVDGLAVVGAS